MPPYTIPRKANHMTLVSVLNSINDKLLRSAGSANLRRGMLKLAFGSGLARLVGICSIPFLSRIYTVEDFGLLSIFASSMLLIIPLMTFRYSSAIPLPRSQLGAFCLVSISCLIIVTSGVVLGLTLFWLSAPIFSAIGASGIASWWWLLLIGGAAGALYEVLLMWSTRDRNYSLIARAQIVQSIISEFLKISLGMLSAQPISLMVGQTSGYSGGISRLLFLYYGDFRVLFKRLTWRRVVVIAARYIGFPKYRLFGQLILVLSAQAPIFLTSALYGIEETGQLSIAIMAVSAPFLLIGQSVSRAYFGEISHLALSNKKDIEKLLYTTMAQLFIISLIPSTALIFYGEYILTVILGQEWKTAGEMSSILALMITPQLVSSSLLRTLDVMALHRQVILLYSQRLILICLVYSICSFLELDVMKTLWAYAIVTSIHYAIQLLAIVKSVRLRG